MTNEKDIPKLPYGEGKITIYNDKLYMFRKTLTMPNGKKIRKAVYAETVKKCMQKMNEEQRKLQQQNKSANKIVLIDGIYTWLNTVHKPTVKPQSYQRLMGTAKNQIEPSAIGHVRYQDITTEEIQAVINKLNEDGLSHSTIKKTYNLLGAFYKYKSAFAQKRK